MRGRNPMTAELRLFGPGLLLCGAGPVRLHSAKVLALLAFLALEAGTAHRRDKLAALLWGEGSPNGARQSLRQALYSLRQACSELATSIRVDGELVAFQPGPEVEVDALRFAALAQSASPEDWETAAAGYTGPLLEGLSIADSDEFEDWLRLKRHAFEQQAIGVLDRLVGTLWQRGSSAAAQAHAERLLALDPVREPTHRHLLRLAGALEGAGGVRRQFERISDISIRHLGVPPGGETAALFEALSVETHGSVAQETSSQEGVARGAPPFVGRREELAELQRRLRRAILGEGSAVAIVGEPGIGKTRLATELARWTDAGGPGRAVQILHSSCYALDVGAPLSMWSEHLQQLLDPAYRQVLSNLDGVWRRELARLVPALDALPQASPELPEDGGMLRLRQAVVTALATLARRSPLLTLIEDLHWADDDSLALLGFAIRQLASERIFFVLTWRAEAVAEKPALTALQLAATLRPGPLEAEEATPLLDWAGIDSGSAAGRAALELSEGNPWVLVETLRMLARGESTGARPAPGRTPLGATAGMAVPASVVELVRARSEAVTDQDRQVLVGFAIPGRPADPALIGALLAQTEPSFVDSVARLIARGFLRDVPGPGRQMLVGFAHDYLRQAVYASASAYERTVLHRRMAETLLARPDVESSLLEEIAWHFEQACDPRAVDRLAQAAHKAESLFALGGASDLYARALAALETTRANDHARRFDLLLAREAVLDRLGRRSEQQEVLAELLRVAGCSGDAGRVATALVRDAGFLAYTSRVAEAHAAGERALSIARAGKDRSAEARALRELGFVHWSNGDFSAALRYAREALALHRVTGNLGGEATALHNLAEIHRGLGSPKRALQLYEDALHLHWSARDARGEVLTVFGMAHALHQLGAVEQARDRLRRALALSEEVGDRLMGSRACQALALLAREDGALDDAVQLMERALSWSRGAGYAQGVAYDLLELGYLYQLRGESANAAKALQDAVEWLRLIEDDARLAHAERQLQALASGNSAAPAAPERPYWVKSHVAVPEGKVYCEFESSLAGAAPR
jgi:DNA-binding SARP family transcriptional activator/tetratricopeptide (TPR) repeat protein